MSDSLRKTLAALGLSASAALLGAALGATPFFSYVERTTYDLRFRLLARPESASRDIVLVTIDDKSIRSLAPVVGRWPWPRLAHGDLIDYLSRGPARVIVYDVLFGEPDIRDIPSLGITAVESDRGLVDATGRAGNVVHAVDVNAVTKLTPPFPDLAAASASLGHTFVALDSDGPVRRMVPFVDTLPGIKSPPALAVAASELVLGVKARVDDRGLWLGNRLAPLTTERVASFERQPVFSRRMLMNFRGAALRDDGKTPTYTTYSFYDLFYSEHQLRDSATPLVDPSSFRGKVVFIGVTAAGLYDIIPSPFGSTGRMPGVQFHAAAVDDLLSGRFMRPAPTSLGVWTLIVGSVIIATVAVFAGFWTSLGGFLALGVALTLWSSFLFGRGLWLPVVPSVLGMAFAEFGGVAYQYFVEGREKRRVKQVFSRFVARDIYEQLMEDPARARLGGERREMSVLFADIRGFTSLSERGQPEEIVSQLNQYFSRMVPVLFAHHGTVDKFVGDMIMALFGAPLPDPEHADHAVTAALEMSKELGALNASWQAAGGAPLDIGIGINSGPMVAGNIGSDTIMSYTVIGDAVNLGARLESLNKEYGTRIIISEGTRSRLQGSYQLRPLGQVTVKGKLEPVSIFEVVTAAETPSPNGAAHTH